MRGDVSTYLSMYVLFHFLTMPGEELQRDGSLAVQLQTLHAAVTHFVKNLSGWLIGSESLDRTVPHNSSVLETQAVRRLHPSPLVETLRTLGRPFSWKTLWRLLILQMCLAEMDLHARAKLTCPLLPYPWRLPSGESATLERLRRPCTPFLPSCVLARYYTKQLH